MGKSSISLIEVSPLDFSKKIEEAKKLSAKNDPRYKIAGDAYELMSKNCDEIVKVLRKLQDPIDNYLGSLDEMGSKIAKDIKDNFYEENSLSYIKTSSLSETLRINYFKNNKYSKYEADKNHYDSEFSNGSSLWYEENLGKNDEKKIEALQVNSMSLKKLCKQVPDIDVDPDFEVLDAILETSNSVGVIIGTPEIEAYRKLFNECTWFEDGIRGVSEHMLDNLGSYARPAILYIDESVTTYRKVFNSLQKIELSVHNDILKIDHFILRPTGSYDTKRGRREMTDLAKKYLYKK